MTTAQDAVQTGLMAEVFGKVDALRDEIVDAVSKAVQIPSVNPRYPGQVYDDVVGGEGRVSHFMADLYAALGAKVDLFAIEPGRENAVGVVAGAGGGRSLIYNGHVDVVPPGDAANWLSGDPFSGKVDGGRIWGRGATDMKSGIVAQAFAARALRECGVRLKGDLILEAVVGEEVMDHECGVTATVKRGYKADAAVVSEPTTSAKPLTVMPVSPGLLWFSVSVTGKATHAAMRGQTIHAGGAGAEIGVSAIDKGFLLFEAIRRLEQEWGFSKRHELFAPGHFSMLPGVVVGSPPDVQVPFFVPDQMTLEYCCWYSPDDDVEDVKVEIERQVRTVAQSDPWLREHPPTLEWKIDWPANRPAADEITAATCAAQQLAASGTRFAGEARVEGFPAVDDATWLTLGGTPAISYGPGDLKVAHADDEFVEIDEVLCATRAFAALAMDWCGIA
ncbi:MAG: ArgE/DapE family deacylase [Actinobacteria bacterium]|nr:ArgE/DapE family deacylase [Actinomycetota bacterium]